MASFPNSPNLFILKQMYIKIKNENNFPNVIFLLSSKDDRSFKKYKKIDMQNIAEGISKPFSPEKMV
tara:strand:+ start:128 stop:328 length:201 start_codon:yes stop_codon:yes gene_type:complete